MTTGKLKQIKVKSLTKNYSHYSYILHLKICLAFFFSFREKASLGSIHWLQTRDFSMSASQGVKLWACFITHSLKQKFICKWKISILRAYVVTKYVWRREDVRCPLLLPQRLSVDCSYFLTLKQMSLAHSINIFMPFMIVSLFKIPPRSAVS